MLNVYIADVGTQVIRIGAIMGVDNEDESLRCEDAENILR
jgi:hypothetical protein